MAEKIISSIYFMRHGDLYSEKNIQINKKSKSVYIFSRANEPENSYKKT